MNNWVYKCSANGDWSKFFKKNKTTRWGNSTDWPQVAQIQAGDLVLACQSNAKALVGLARVSGFKARKVKHGSKKVLKTLVFVEPLLDFNVSLTELRAESKQVRVMSAFKPGPAMGTIKKLKQDEWETLFAAIRSKRRARAANGSITEKP